MDRSHVEEITPLISKSGIPAAVRDIRQNYQKQLAVYLILASTIFERIAYYTLLVTLAITADPDGGQSSQGPMIALIFTGTSNISTLIFAILSDWKLGRSKTIIFGFVLYLIGYIMTIIFTSGTIQSCKDIFVTETIFDKQCFPWILSTLIVIAIGAGAVQSNMAVFGAEQMQETRAISRYFDKYVLAINIGAIFAKSAIYLSVESYLYVCISGASTLVLATLLFLIGYRYYIHVKSDETIITKCIPVTINALQTWHQYHKNKSSKRRASLPSTIVYNSRVVIEEDESARMDLQVSTFLDYAKATNHGKYIDRVVDDVKSLRGALAVFILLIPYWLIYDQLNSTFRIQARHMQGTDNNSMVTVSLADPVILIIGILILNIFVYKYLVKRNRLLSTATKFIIGMCVGVITMCVAGVVEIVRQKEWNADPNISNLSIYSEIPQGLCMGISELFVMVASFEFAYFAAPRSAQTLFMSLRFSSIGLASFIGTGYIAVFRSKSSPLDFSWKPESEDQWRYYTYFFILAALQFIFIIIFIVCQRKFEIIRTNRQRTEKGHFHQHSTISVSTRQ